MPEPHRRQIEEQLDEIGVRYVVDSAGDIAVSYGDTTTYLRSFEHGGRPLVRIWAITNVDLPLSDELGRFLVTENATFPFGGFEANAGRVAFSHTLLGGRFLQRRELETALSAVVGTAERYNDEIKSRFGGRLFGER
jgi:Putative bacterial sensory transduction regulator